MKAYIRTLCVLMAMASAALTATAQPPSPWNQTYGGDHDQICYAVQRTLDGGYVLAGETSFYGPGSQGYLLVKTDILGSELWTHFYGTIQHDIPSAVVTLADGGYLVAGYRVDDSNNYSAYVVRANANGDTMWTRIPGGTGIGIRAAVEAGGGYLLAGWQNASGSGSNDFWLCKLTVSGEVEWSHTYGGSASDVCSAMAVAPDGGYYLAGSTQSFGSNAANAANFWLVKVNAIGDSMWSRAYGDDDVDICNSIAVLPDGGCVLGGYTTPISTTSMDFWLLRANAEGDSLTSHTYGGQWNDYCQSVQVLESGCLIAAGTRAIDATFSRYAWAIETDLNLDSAWCEIFGGSSHDYCYAATATPDGGCALAGSTVGLGSAGYDFWLVKVDAAAETLTVTPQELDFGNLATGDTLAHTFTLRNTGTVNTRVTGLLIPPGYRSSQTSGFDLSSQNSVEISLTFAPDTDGVYDDTVWVISTARNNPTPLPVTGGRNVSAAGKSDIAVPAGFALLPAFPNPFNPQTVLTFVVPKAEMVRLSIWDTNGRLVRTLADEMFTAGQHALHFDGSALSSGVYFARLQSGNSSRTQKLVLMK